MRTHVPKALPRDRSMACRLISRRASDLWSISAVSTDDDSGAYILAEYVQVLNLKVQFNMCHLVRRCSQSLGA